MNNEVLCVFHPSLHPYMAPLKTIVYIFTHYDTQTHTRFGSQSFIVHFLSSSQLLPIWRHTNEQLLSPSRNGNTTWRSTEEKEKIKETVEEEKGLPEVQSFVSCGNSEVAMFYVTH